MTLDPSSPWNYERVLMQGGQVKLTDGMSKNMLTTGVSAIRLLTRIVVNILI